MFCCACLWIAGPILYLLPKSVHLCPYTISVVITIAAVHPNLHLCISSLLVLRDTSFFGQKPSQLGMHFLLLNWFAESLLSHDSDDHFGTQKSEITCIERQNQSTQFFSYNSNLRLAFQSKKLFLPVFRRHQS